MSLGFSHPSLQSGQLAPHLLLPEDGRPEESLALLLALPEAGWQFNRIFLLELWLEKWLEIPFIFCDMSKLPTFDFFCRESQAKTQVVFEAKTQAKKCSIEICLPAVLVADVRAAPALVHERVAVLRHGGTLALAGRRRRRGRGGQGGGRRHGRRDGSPQHGRLEVLG